MKKIIDPVSNRLNSSSLFNVVSQLEGDGAILCVPRWQEQIAKLLTFNEANVKQDEDKIEIHIGTNIAINVVEKIVTGENFEWMVFNRHGVVYSYGDGTARSEFPEKEIKEFINFNFK